MKRVLLLGKGKAVFDDIFKYLVEDFEIQTTSNRNSDIKCHLKYFKPEVVVVCLQKEVIEDLIVLNEFKDYFSENVVPVIIIGSNDECEEFQQKTYSLGKLVLLKPISARNIKSRLTEFMEVWDKEHEIKPQPVEPVPTQVSEAASVSAPTPTPTSTPTPAPTPVPAQTLPVEENDKKHILVVDDDPMILKLIKEHLKHKYAVGTAVSGKIALKFLETKKTDLVLLDYEMPVENGAQIMEQIRSNKATAKLPIVFLTGIADKEKIKKVISLKPQGYMLKPVDKEVLLQTIEQIIG